jgi:serine/threonine protein kinase
MESNYYDKGWKLNTIGSGAFGNVYKKNRDHVVKIIAVYNKNGIIEDKSAEIERKGSFVIQKLILDKLRSPHVVTFYGSQSINVDQKYLRENNDIINKSQVTYVNSLTRDESQKLDINNIPTPVQMLYLSYDYCNMEALRNYTITTPETLCRYLWMILWTIHVFHTQRISHNDLNSNNILIVSCNKSRFITYEWQGGKKRSIDTARCGNSMIKFIDFSIMAAYETDEYGTFNGASFLNRINFDKIEKKTIYDPVYEYIANNIKEKPNVYAPGNDLRWLMFLISPIINNNQEAKTEFIISSRKLFQGGKNTQMYRMLTQFYKTLENCTKSPYECTCEMTLFNEEIFNDLETSYDGISTDNYNST